MTVDLSLRSQNTFVLTLWLVFYFHLVSRTKAKIARRHNVLTEMFTITEEPAVLYGKVKFLTSPNSSRHHRKLLIFCR